MQLLQSIAGSSVAGLLFGLMLSVAPGLVQAQSKIVTSLDELQKAVALASPGDVIKLAKGIYTTESDVIISGQGTERQPITIAAEVQGLTEINGKGGFLVQSPSAYLIIKGFRFTHNASRAKTATGTKFCRWTQNVFETPGAGENLTISGSDHQVDYNTFQNKNAMGRFLAVRGEGSQIAERLWIHHNYFYNFPYQGGANGAEPFQFGLSGFSLSSSNSVVEHNLFEKCHGENELISIKASKVTVRYNTIRDCPAQFTLRHGNFCRVYANYFINTPGLRIFGDDHIIHSNYFENCSMGINIGNGGAEVADGAPLVSHDRPDRVLIAFNTLVNNTRNIVQTPRDNGIGATSITVINNLIVGGGPAAEISGPYTNPRWENNIVFNTPGGDIPTGGFQLIDPMIRKDGSGIFHLSKKSPARDKGVGPIDNIEVDIDGQPRDSKPDTGADEFSGTGKNIILQPRDVGHLAPTNGKSRE
jgi:poly(beta-D-mannuronate) lyase